MTITKLALTALLLIFTGLAAWVGAGLAAQQPGGTPRSSLPTATSTPPLTVDATSIAADPSQEARNRREVRRPGPDPAILAKLPPVVVNIEPNVGDDDADPELREIRVTFSKEMTDRSWSWTEGNVYSVPKLDGKIHYESDKRTCVMPVKLEPGKTYVMGINSERFRGFQDVDGRPALPYLLAFRTRAAR
jgi:RNA polymerase sigma-70 factor (ECF subfamily)